MTFAGRASTTAEYAGRVAQLARRHPVEFVDRLISRSELWRERNCPTDHLPLNPEPGVALHRLLGADAACPPCGELATLWEEVRADLESPDRPVGRGHDADLALAQAAWTATLHLRPSAVVETGVARGITSRIVLTALDRLGHGRLFSIDLPPVLAGWHAESTVAVPRELRSRWTFVRGSSRRRLGPLLDEVGTIDLFIHDSLHTRGTMDFEFRQAWSRLRRGGLLLADDVDVNDAFRRFAEEAGGDAWFAAADRHKRGAWGAVRKGPRPA